MKLLKLTTLATLMVIMSCKKETVENEKTTNTSETITYQDKIYPIVYNYCVTCHGSQAPSAGLDLTTYEKVRAAAEGGDLINRINSSTNPMPASGMLSTEQRKRFDDWVASGYKKE